MTTKGKNVHVLMRITVSITCPVSSQRMSSPIPIVFRMYGSTP